MPEEGVRRAIVAGLESRRGEIEGAFWKRIEADPNVREILDAEYMEGLRASVPKALTYGISGIEGDRDHAPQVPAALLTQARLAARNSVALAVVQRRYVDCYHLFAAFLSEEAEKQGEAGVTVLKYLRGTTKALFDQLVDAVEEEYAREHAQPSSPEKRRVDLVKEHLAGKVVDRSELGYEFNYFHVALIARGASAAGAIKDLACELDCLPLVVHLGEGAVWAWLGKRERPNLDELQRLVESRWPAETPLGIGEVGQGDEGSRRTHRQASDAFSLAARTAGRVFRYGDDPLLASVSRDEALVNWLRERYVVPLESARDGGALWRHTLRMYFSAGRNAASAAAKLTVERQTVSYRLKAAEARLGCTLVDRGNEIDLALRLEELGRGSS